MKKPDANESFAPDVNQKTGHRTPSGDKYEVGQKKSILLLIILTLLYTLAYMDRSIMIVMVEPIKADLGFTDAQIGIIHTIFLASVGILTIPCGILADRWSRRKSVALMAIIWSAATYATGLAYRFSTMALARLFTGSGEAGFAPGGVSWISATFSEKKRSLALGVFNTGIPIGGTLGIILGGVIAEKTGDWRTPFYIFAVPGIILGGVAFFMPDYASIKNKKLAAEKWTNLKDIASLFKIKSYTIACLGFGLWMFLIFGVMSWLTALFMREYNIALDKAGIIVGLIVLTGAVGAPLGGFLADKYQLRRRNGRYRFIIIAVFFGSITKLILLFTIGSSMKMLIIAGMLDSIISMMSPPVFFAITQDIAPIRLRATATSIAIYLIFLLGGAWGPAVIGKVSDILGGDAAGLKAAMFYMLPFGLLSAITFIIGSRYYAADKEGVGNIISAE